jgi:hypothetical protein
MYKIHAGLDLFTLGFFWSRKHNKGRRGMGVETQQLRVASK